MPSNGKQGAVSAKSNFDGIEEGGSNGMWLKQTGSVVRSATGFRIHFVASRRLGATLWRMHWSFQHHGQWNNIRTAMVPGIQRQRGVSRHDSVEVRSRKQRRLGQRRGGSLL